MIIGDILVSAVILAGMIAALVMLTQEKTAGVSPCPSLPGSRKKIIEMLLAEENAGKPLKIAELGCGWGGLVAKLATTYQNAQIIGYETSFLPLIFSFVRNFGQKRVEIRRKDFLKEDLSSFDAVICYLSPAHIQQLRPMLSHLRPCSTIISNAFSIPEWTPKRVETISLIVNIPIYLYKV